MTTHGMVHWNELMTWDTKKARDFYGKTLGWSFEDAPMPGGTYTIIKSGDQMVGGMMEMTKGEMFDGMPEHWFVYIAVDDVDERLTKLKDAGGKVLREPFDVPGAGRVAIVADAGGAAQGWMVPAPNSM